MNRTALTALLAVTVLLAGCASFQPKSDSAEKQNRIDWAAVFATYGSRPGENGSEDRAKLESLFAANPGNCAQAAVKTLENPASTREQFSGAADAAGWLRADSCQPALEAGLRNTDWFRRFACANALDTIDSSSSEKAVLAALDKETHGMVAMALAMYLQRHPSAEAQKILERKSGEFAARMDDDALIAQLFIEDALAAGRNVMYTSP
jgi:hypothetical protein